MTALLQCPVIILIQQDKGSHLPGVFLQLRLKVPAATARRFRENVFHGFVLLRSFVQIVRQVTERAGRKVAGPFLDSDTDLQNGEKEDLSVRD